jgi:porin
MSNRITLWSQSFKRHLYGKHASSGSGAPAAVLSVAFMSLSVPLFAQDANSAIFSQLSNVPDLAAQSDGPQSPAQVVSTPSPVSTGWYDINSSKVFSAMSPKGWGPASSLAPDLGDTLLGDAGGVRSALADHGFAGYLFVGGTQWQNLLKSPTKTDGTQMYVGQKYTAEMFDAFLLTYDLGHIGLSGAQILVDGGCSVSSFLPAFARACRAQNLTFYDSFFRGRVELTAGILANDLAFVDTYVGGNTNTGAFGPQAVLPVQSGLSNQPGVAPGLNVTYHLDSKWYDKIGVQRSVSPEGLVQDYSHFDRHGLAFTEPNAKALVIDEVGFRQTATSDEFFTYVRMGGLYNWTQYRDFTTGGTSTNWNTYLLADRQFIRADADLPYRGWYGGFSVMESPSNVNVFRSYYEARVYDIAPFKSRPADQFNVVSTYSLFSGDARQYYFKQGFYPPRKSTASVTMAYAYKVTHGTYITPGLSYTNNPSFIYEPGQGHDLNFFLSINCYL